MIISESEVGEAPEAPEAAEDAELAPVIDPEAFIPSQRPIVTANILQP